MTRSNESSVKPLRRKGEWRAGMRAFTLIEVMAALVIVSLGMLAVIQAVSSTASNTAYLREKTVAHWVAMNKMTDVRLLQQPPPMGKSTGDVTMGNLRWRWTVTVSATDVPSMRRIDVDVSPGDGDEDNRLASLTGFYGEKIAQPGVVQAQFEAPPVPLQGQPNPQGAPQTPTPQIPGDPSQKPEPPPDEATP
jgi:general secretion pathway protein I